MKTATRKRERGQVVVFTALGMVCLMGFLGFATDIGILWRDKVNLQKVADAAAIAAAAQLIPGAGNNYTAAAQDSAAQNGVTNGTNGTVTVTLGTTYHPNAIQVYVSQVERTYFMGVFGFRTMTVGASAAAGLTNGNGCLFALDTNPFKQEGMTMNGTGDIDAPQCQIYDNSGLNMDGTSGIIKAQSVYVSGSYSPGNVTPVPITGTVPVPDPLAYWTAPTPSGACASNPNLSSGTVSPGCYHGLTLSGSVTMSPGLYIIQNGALNLNGSGSGITGNGVTIFIDGANGGTFSSVNGSNLTAPTSGTSGTCTSAGCNGMLIWDTESTGKAQQGLAFGPGNSTLTGILYFPNASLKWHGNVTTTLNADVLAASYVFDGTININNYVLTGSQDPLFLTPTILE